jgi:hypothetical protein
MALRGRPSAGASDSKWTRTRSAQSAAHDATRRRSASLSDCGEGMPAVSHASPRAMLKRDKPAVPRISPSRGPTAGADPAGPLGSKTSYAQAVIDGQNGNPDEVTASTTDAGELERRAYGRTSTAEEELDALAARRSLLELGRHSNPTVTPDPGPANVDPLRVEATAKQGVIAKDADASRRPRIRRAVPFVVVGVVALVLGGLVGRVGPALPPASTPPSATPALGSTSMSITMSARDRTASTIGQSLFSRAQQPTDKFPFYDENSPEYQPSTVRLVATSTALGSVYIAKRGRLGAGVCLMLVSPKASDGSQTGTTGCASTSSFLAHGIVLKVIDTDESVGQVAHWTVHAITVSSTQ